MKKLKDPDYLSSGLFRTNWADQWNLCILLTVLIEDDTISSFEIMDVSKELMEYWGLGESDDVYNIEEISDELAGLDIIDVCKELDERFGIAHLSREWYGIGLSKQCGTLYGLLILLASSFVQVRDTTKDILKRLLRFEMGRVAGGWEPMSMLFLMGDLEDAKANFLGNVKPWCEVKTEIKLESIMEAINLVVDLMEEGRQHITHSSCRLLSYCALQCSHLEVLSYLFEKLSPHGMLPNCQTMDKDGDPLSYVIYRILEAELHGVALDTHEYSADFARELALCHQRYDPLKKGLLCSFLLRLIMLNTEHNALLHLVVLEIEKLEPNERVWVERAPLLDRLLIIAKNRNLEARKAALETIDFLASNMGQVYLDIDHIVLDLAKIFAGNPEVTVLAGKCLLQFLNFDCYPLDFFCYNKIIKMISRSKPMQEEVEQLQQQLIALAKQSLSKAPLPARFL